MSALYAESSALLRWLLGHSDGPAVQRALGAAPAVVTSAITSAEVARTLERLVATNHITAVQRGSIWTAYTQAAQHWSTRACSDDVLARAQRGFPREPVRTLDAIHLATAELYVRDVAPLAMLSTDARVRENAAAMGMVVVP